MRTTIWLLLCASSLGACKWTEFDDLSNETWVLSIDKPNVKSSDYGIAIVRGDNDANSATSGTLAVIGASPGTYSELAFTASGGSTLKSNGLVLVDQGIMTLEPSPPILLASPDAASAEVALITTGDTSSIVVATGTHTLLVRQLFVNNTTLENSVTITSTPDAATYMQPGVFSGIADPPPPEPLVASGDVVLGTVYGLPSGTKQPACKLIDGTTVVQIRALGAFRPVGATTDDVLMWNATDGKLHRYPTKVFNGCLLATPTQAPSASTTGANIPAFLPGKGSQILKFDDNHVVLQGHQDVGKGSAGFLQVYEISPTIKPVGNAVTIDGLRYAAIIAVGGTSYVLAGYPSATVDGKSGGQVLMYKLSPSTGINPTTPIATLHDAQPDDNQSFGRSIAAMPYNGKQVIAIAADNEIFVYFRANLGDGTALYAETRQGR